MINLFDFFSEQKNIKRKSLKVKTKAFCLFTVISSGDFSGEELIYLEYWCRSPTFKAVKSSEGSFVSNDFFLKANFPIKLTFYSKLLKIYVYMS